MSQETNEAWSIQLSIRKSLKYLYVRQMDNSLEDSSY